jgi:hypothetical protein
VETSDSAPPPSLFAEGLAELVSDGKRYRSHREHCAGAIAAALRVRGCAEPGAFSR